MGLQQQNVSQDTVDYAGYMQSSHGYQICGKHSDRQQPQVLSKLPDQNSSFTSTKGLLNGPGQNNCFLNSAVQVSVYVGHEHLCGGVLISKDFVLSVGHCLKTNVKVNGEAVNLLPLLQIKSGSSLTNSGGEFHKIKSIHIHENFQDGVAQDDIGLVEVEEPFTFNESQRPISLAKPSENPNVNDTIQVSGYGQTEFKERSDELQMAYLKVVNLELCKQLYRKANISDAICAGYFEKGPDTCDGDSGGPAVYNGRLVGIILMGETDCSIAKNYPGVYLKVSNYLGWISSITGLQF